MPASTDRPEREDPHGPSRPPEILQADAALRASVSARLAGFELYTAGEHPHAAAAVAVVITEEGHGAALDGLPQHTVWQRRAALILTKRSLALRHHPGQWALPGGRIEPGESPEQAALRELHEEVGLALDATRVLGRLDDYVTRSGFVVTPVVVWAGAAPGLEANPAEVSSIHRIPIAEFLRADAPKLFPTTDPLRPVLRMPAGTAWMGAPTAVVVYQFCEVCISGRATRVAHFDAPVSAWT